jgi:hypothetical protein
MSTTIETITVTRPMKVIAFILTTMSVFLLIGATTSSDWVNNGQGWREGLFEQCVNKGSPLPLPFDQTAEEGCRRVRSAGYIRGAGALIIIGLFTDFFGALLTGLGLRSTDPNKKYKYYRVAIYSLIVAVLVMFLLVIIYPVSFSKDAANTEPYAGYELGSSAAALGDLDFDNDGVIDSMDNDDDNDGIPDDEDNDDDNDGIPDNQDDDDDNDGIPDALDVDVESDGDLDDDGIPDAEDVDDDNDGVPDAIDNDDDNDGIPDDIDDDSNNDDDDDEEIPDKDTDGDGIPDKDDPDIDNDGTLNVDDDDDDGDGVDDAIDMPVAGDPVVFSWGFGYGASWCCLIFMFISLVLLICDRESEEIFYKEREAEEEEEEEA